MSAEHIKDVLFFAGTDWSGQTPDEIVKALDIAGYVIVPREVLLSAYGLMATSGDVSEQECARKLSDCLKVSDAQMAPAPLAPA